MRSAFLQSLPKNMGGGGGAAAAGTSRHAEQLCYTASCRSVRPTCCARPPSAPVIPPPTCVGVPDRKGFRRLVQPNGICLTGLWQITEDIGYSGYFRNGSRALIVGRYSTCCRETRRGHV